MSSSKLSSIYEKNNINEIKIYDLQRYYIKDSNINSVKELIRILNRKFLLHFIVVFLFFIGTTFMLYYSFKTTTEWFNGDTIVPLAMDLILLLVLFYISRQIRHAKNFTYEKAQYGVVKSKYALRATADTDSHKNYYINVTFLDTNTYIRGVSCTGKVYKTLIEGSEVLVISFDNKIAYAIPCI